MTYRAAAHRFVRAAANGGAVMRHQKRLSPVASEPADYGMTLWKSFRIFLSILFLVAAAGATEAAWADSQARAVRLSNVVGSVQVLNGSEVQFSQAYANMPLMQASTLKTGEDGRVEIQFEDGSIVRLTPNSSAMLGVLSRDDAGNTNTEVNLLTGLSYIEMSGTANQRFLVRFGGNEVISPAPAKFRVDLDSNPVELAMLDGSAHVSSGTTYAVDVKANESLRFDASDASRYFLAEGITSDSWDQWNADRDQALGLMAQQETREARANGNPNDPAWSDLDYYGNWYAGPDGSPVWSPSGVGVGWDPYGSGYWGYYGTGGYAWISGYPWGWLPYHCGAWAYYNSFGWGWAPGAGGCGSLWYPVGGISFAPPGYQRPVHPPIGHLPVHGPVNIPKTLVRVDRGPEATQITPHAVVTPRTVTLNGEPARLLPKAAPPSDAPRAVRAANSFASRTTNPSAGRTEFGGIGGQPTAMPVYRPAPSAPLGSRQGYSAPVYAPHSGGGSMMSAPHYSAPPAASAPHFSAPPAAAPAGGGGGHVK